MAPTHQCLIVQVWLVCGQVATYKITPNTRNCTAPTHPYLTTWVWPACGPIKSYQVTTEIAPTHQYVTTQVWLACGQVDTHKNIPNTHYYRDCL